MQKERTADEKVEKWREREYKKREQQLINGRGKVQGIIANN